MDKAIVCNIQRFSLDDGPGIRTTVFLKGCPLECLWCHNPECIAPVPQLEYLANRCRQCGACVQACPRKLHALQDGAHTADLQKCIACGACVETCIYDALVMTGKPYALEELEAALLKDQAFYTQSGGGVTFSGGEPLLHAGYLEMLMPRLKKQGISVAVDTCGYVDQSAIRAVSPYTDLFLYDIKAMDRELHQKLTGRFNDRIVDNLRFLCTLGIPVWIRIPLIRGENDSMEDLTRTAQVLSSCDNIRMVELLPYHKYGVAKYDALGIPYYGNDFEAPEKEQMEQIAELFQKQNLPVSIR